MIKEKFDELRKRKNDLIWAGGSAKEIMRLARRVFRETAKMDLPAAHIELASDHYSLIKRYMHSLRMKPLAAWHSWRAARNVGIALMLRFADTFTTSQIDVVTRILTRVPKRLGGDKNTAAVLLNDVLYITPRDMVPHTRALMLMTLGELYCSLGKQYEAAKCYNQAHELKGAIFTEDSPDRLKQLARVLFGVGAFFYTTNSSTRDWARGVIKDAYEIAGEHSMDQAMKIREECERLGVRLE